MTTIRQLVAAAKHGNVAAVRKFIEQDTGDYNNNKSDGTTPPRQRRQETTPNKKAKKKKKKMSPHKTRDAYRRALWFAAKHGHARVVDKLVAHASIDQYCFEDALEVAIDGNRIEVVDRMLRDPRAARCAYWELLIYALPYARVVDRLVGDALADQLLFEEVQDIIIEGHAAGFYKSCLRLHNYARDRFLLPNIRKKHALQLHRC